jgi:hypothetical protein
VVDEFILSEVRDSDNFRELQCFPAGIKAEVLGKFRKAQESSGLH